jgi:alpha/beta superfamily hydrolase
MTPPALERITIDGAAGSLEVVVEDIATEDGSASRGSSPAAERAPRRHAVVCHPHPLFGGTMDNKVVTTLARGLQECGIPTLRFNFRGVGQSAGVFDSGVGETTDAAAVAAWGAARWPGSELVIAGFSFGAYVALRLSQQAVASRLITVAPPVARFDFSGLRAPRCPWLVVQGDADEVVDAQQVIAWAEALEPQPRLVVMPGVGHFFHGRLIELRGAVIDAIRED